MTQFNLTTGNDRYTGGASGDVFSGYGGGTDALRGKGGNDTFRIQYQQKGLIDGGTGTDSIYMTGHNNHTLNSKLKLVSIENIYLSETNFYASAKQISEFEKIKPLYNGGNFYVNIEGNGGKVDLTNSYSSSPKLHIEAYDSTAAVDMTGSKKSDFLVGSSFGDKLNGGLGLDTLTGEDGNDRFVFSTKISKSNVDLVTDFTKGQDKIALESDIFKGVTSGNLSATFHDVTAGGVQSNDRILYNHDTGWLSYDKDGNGGSAAVHFATIESSEGVHPMLTWNDFLVV